MSNRHRVSFAFVLCVGIGALLWGASQRAASADPKPEPAPPPGRFQQYNVKDHEEPFLLDTATGKLWRLRADDSGRGSLSGKWVLVADVPK